MTALTSEWPEHFPACCPPDVAPDVSGEVFRLVMADPPSETDTKSYLELGKGGKGRECLRAGLSCAKTREHLEELRALPTLKGCKIAAATLTPDHGKMMQTGAAGHHTLWLRASVLPEARAMFRVVA